MLAHALAHLKRQRFNTEPGSPLVFLGTWRQGIVPIGYQQRNRELEAAANEEAVRMLAGMKFDDASGELLAIQAELRPPRPAAKVPSLRVLP